MIRYRALTKKDLAEIEALERETFDLVLLDPPYHHDTLQEVLPALEHCVAQGGVVLCESESEAELPETVGTLHLQKQYKYGKIKVSRYEREGQE